MNPLLVFWIAGWSFWVGLAATVAAMAALWFARNRWQRTLAGVLLLIGFLFTASSALPVPRGLFTCYAFLCLLSLQQWLPWLRFKRMVWGLTATLALLLAAVELPHWLDPEPIPVPSGSRVWVLADSISAGVGYPGEKTWSDLLNEARGGGYLNRAVGGGTLASGIQTLETFNARPGDVLLIELGGNDLLRGHSTERFRRELEALLLKAAGTGMPAVMLELPLPPTRTGYGRAQRELARQHLVTLIPRRRFASVWRGAHTTVDGLHLSNSGHENFVAMIAPFLEPAPGTTPFSLR